MSFSLLPIDIITASDLALNADQTTLQQLKKNTRQSDHLVNTPSKFNDRIALLKDPAVFCPLFLTEPLKVRSEIMIINTTVVV